MADCYRLDVANDFVSGQKWKGANFRDTSSNRLRVIKSAHFRDHDGDSVTRQIPLRSRELRWLPRALKNRRRCPTARNRKHRKSHDGVLHCNSRVPSQ